jgi:hypothetical protein
MFNSLQIEIEILISRKGFTIRNVTNCEEEREK